MAIYHLSVKTFSRSKGQSATAAVAYRAGAKVECEREGRTHDYTKKGGVLHSEIFLPDDAPDWAADRQQLWNKAEEAETRKNSTVAREFEVALPKELDEQQRIELVQDFAKQIVARHGCAVDAHLHDDDSRRTNQNHHAHIMLTTRKLEQDGFTNKTRELDQKQSGEVVYWREQWAKTANEHLRDNGIEKHIDHRSLKDQGLEREPTIKMGVNASALERKGIKTERGDHNRAVTAYNPDKLNQHLTTQYNQALEFHNKLNFIKRRLPEIKRDLAEKQPNLYQSLDDLGIPTPECHSNERGRGLSPTGSIESHKLGQGHTEARRAEDKTITSTAPRNQVERPQKPLEPSEQLEAPTAQDNAVEANNEQNRADEMAQKRLKVQAFLAKCDEQAEKYHKHKLSQLRDKAQPLLAEISNLKDKKPLNPFKTKAWQEQLDNKIEQYDKIKSVHDDIKDKGVTAEDRQAVYTIAYKRNPKAYDSIHAMNKEVRTYDKEQAQHELEQRQAQLAEVREQREITKIVDRGMER
ncbi:MobQ family relaxase [Psychrobacter celer]|uniref:MobQ family relaxase n=1 Tax=Psychrobacter celer TaxID=306572 RepID=UPI003FD5A388